MSFTDIIEAVEGAEYTHFSIDPENPHLWLPCHDRGDC